MVADEAKLRRETTTKSIWYLKGKRPIIFTKQEKKSKSFYGALNVKTGKEHTHICDWQESRETIKFLEKLRNVYKNQNIFLIWDNAKWHKSQEIRDYLKTINNLTLMNFPPYSPEFNPQEMVWKQARNNISHNRFEKDFKVLINDFANYLETTIFHTNFLKKYSRF